MKFTEHDEKAAKQKLLSQAINGDSRIRQNMLDCIKKGMIPNMTANKLEYILDNLKINEIWKKQKGVINGKKRGSGQNRKNN